MDKKFFCIRGYMKSGTNWLCRILKCHPLIDCVGEFHWESFYGALNANANRIAPKRKDNYLQTVSPHLETMIKESLIQFADPNAVWIGDRTPTTISPIAITDAPHFVIVRDIRDVVVSRMFHLFSHPRITTVFDQYPEMKIKLEHFQNDHWYFRNNPGELLNNEEIVRNSAREWAAFIEADDKTHHERPELSVLRLRYEDLHENFEASTKSLFQFIGESAPSDFPDRIRPGLTEESPTKLNRKGIVGDWQNYMDDQCQSWIVEEAGTQMRKMGYQF